MPNTSPPRSPRQRLPGGLLAAVLALVLAGCATPAAAPPAAAADTPGASPLPVYVEAAPRAPAAAPPAPDDGRAFEPTLLRGNDTLLGRGQPGKAVTGPASTFKFEQAPVAEVVHVMLRDILKVDYVVYPPLNGNITLATRGNVSADKAMLLLESALQVNGIVMARDTRGTYHVGRPEALRGIVAAPRVAGNGPLSPGYGAVVFPLQYLGAGEMASILQSMAPADAIVRVDTVRNILVMQGTRAQAEGWAEIIDMFDVNLLRGMSIGVFPLKYVTAKEIDDTIRLLTGGTPTPAAPAAGATGGAPGTTGAPAAAARARGATGAPSAASAALDKSSPLHGALRIMPIERINAIIVVTPRRAYLEEVRYWIEQLDRPNNDGAQAQLFVYKVRNGSADHLAELLNGIFGGTPGTTGATGATGATGVAPGLAARTAVTGGIGGAFGTPNRGFGQTGGFGAGGFGSGGFGGGGFGGGGFGVGQNLGQGVGQGGPGVTSVTLGGGVRVMADRINNALLVHATAAEYERIEKTLLRLDVQRAQVLIEASIVEVSLGDDLKYGLQWAFRGGVGGGRSGQGVISTAAGGELGGALSGFSYTLSNAAGNITAVLNALAAKSKLKVISSPSLMVLDNHTASIAVGDQQPIKTGTVTNGNVTIGENIQYKDTGVMLNVTPSVNAGDLVTLDIQQSITDVGADIDAATGQRAFLQRQINSRVAVRSGETLVLGGLIKDSNSSSRSGVPILSSIPVLGALFGTHSDTANRTELLVVFTPRVLRTDDDARAIGRELRDRMRGLTVDGLVGGTPTR